MRIGDPSAGWLLLAVVAALAGLVWGVVQRRRALQRLGDHPVLMPLLAEVSTTRRRWRGALLVLALLALAGATLRPQWGAHTELARHRGLDLVFALDLSQSMRARDVRPDRLERARAEIAALTEQLAGNRMGLVAFAGTAFVQCPLTTDTSALRMFLRALEPEAVPQGGTALAKALTVAARLFEQSSAQSSRSGRRQGQVLVLITDGEDHEGEVQAAGARLKEAGVTVFAVGVGSEQGEPIPLFGENDRVIGYLKDKQGKPVLSRLGTGTLQTLVEASGGQLLSGPQVGRNLLQVAREIDKLEKAEFESRLVVQHRERYQWPLALALAALLAAAAVRERRRPGEEEA